MLSVYDQKPWQKVYPKWAPKTLPFFEETILDRFFRGKIIPYNLIAFCKKQMEAYKYPRIIEIIEEVPKTITGKFLWRKLRG